MQEIKNIHYSPEIGGNSILEFSIVSKKINTHGNKFGMTRFSGFTLVELIVVITILVILGTIAFMQLGSFAGSARDSSRITLISNLKTGLDLFQIKSGTYPLPENSVNITASGASNIIAYQGFAKDQIGSIAKLSPGGTIDPLDATMYTTYSVNTNQTKMQIMTFLEDGSTVTAFVPNALIPETSASSTSDYSKRYPKTLGDTLGILLSTATGTLNQPVQETNTGVDVVLTNTGYLAVFRNKENVSGTGIVLSVVSSMGAKSCNDLLLKDSSKKNKDSVYYINPTLSSSNTGSFQVYCDMTTDGGGWSLIISNSIDQLNSTQINSLFQNSSGIFRYKIGTNTIAFYKRLTGLSNFILYSYISTTWSSIDNILNTNFVLYTTFLDVINNTNPWNFCNYDDPGVGFPRDCGPSVFVASRWYGPSRPGQNGTFHLR